MEVILVPTDFSEEANNALHAAHIIAKKCEAKLVLVHIIDANFDASFNREGEIDHMGDMDQVFVLKMVDVAKEQLEDIKKQENLSDIEIETEVLVGNPFENIFRKINEIDADLVVMGTSGASGLAEILVGSNTEKVVRMAKCPVLSLKTPITDVSFDNIVFASDLGEKQDMIIDRLKEFQQFFGSTLHLVRVNTPNNFQADRLTKEQMKRFVEKNQLKEVTINIYNDAIEEDGIMNFAADINAEMIAMATHGRRGISHLFSGSIAEDVVNHAKRPVLTFNLRD